MELPKGHIFRILKLPDEKIREMREHHKIYFRHVGVFGPPETGKTTWVKSLAAVIEKICEEQGIDFICFRAMRLEDIFAYLDDEPLLREQYVVCFIDDAEAMNPSGNRKENRLATTDHDLIRHELARRGLRQGVITVVYATQRFRNLAPALRVADALAFKGINRLDPYEAGYLEKVVGGRGVHYLSRLMWRIRMWDEDAKSEAFVRFLNGYYYVQRLYPPREPQSFVDLWSLSLEMRRASSNIGREAAVYSSLAEMLEAGCYDIYHGRYTDYVCITKLWLRKYGLDLNLVRLAEMLGDMAKYRTVSMYGRRVMAVLFPVSKVGEAAARLKGWNKRRKAEVVV